MKLDGLNGDIFEELIVVDDNFKKNLSDIDSNDEKKPRKKWIKSEDGWYLLSKMQVIKTAKQLGYKKKFIDQLKEAETDIELNKIMRAARKDRFGD